MASSEPCITSFFERKKYLDAMAYFLCKGEELYLCAGIIKIFVCVCVCYIVDVDVRENFVELYYVPSFHFHTGSGDQTQVSKACVRVFNH